MQAAPSLNKIFNLVLFTAGLFLQFSITETANASTQAEEAIKNSTIQPDLASIAQCEPQAGSFESDQPSWQFRHPDWDQED